MTIPRIPSGVSSHGGEFAERIRSAPELELVQLPTVVGAGISALVEYRDASTARRASIMQRTLDEFEHLSPRDQVAEWRMGADSRFAVVFTTFTPRDCPACGGFWFFERDDEIPYCPQCAGIDGAG